MFKFSNAKARDVCDVLLRSNMSSVRPPRETWISRKKAFEVILRNVPDTLDRSLFNNTEGVVKVLDIKHGRVVLFMSSLKAASEICDKGVWYNDMFFGASPYSFTPRMYCKTCGKLGHKSCEIMKCFKCGGLDHVGNACPIDQKTSEPYCVHCSTQGHFYRTCPIAKAKSLPALVRKQKTYADALKALAFDRPGTRTILQRQPGRRQELNMYEKHNLISSIFQVVIELFNIKLSESDIDDALDKVMDKMFLKRKSNVGNENDVNDEEKKTSPVRSPKVVRSRDDDEVHAEKSSRTMTMSSDEDTDEPARKGKKTAQEPPKPLNCSCGKDYTMCTSWANKNHLVTCSCGEVYRKKKAFLVHLSECTDIFMKTSC